MAIKGYQKLIYEQEGNGREGEETRQEKLVKKMKGRRGREGGDEFKIRETRNLDTPTEQVRKGKVKNNKVRLGRGKVESVEGKIKGEGEDVKIKGGQKLDT